MFKRNKIEKNNNINVEYIKRRFVLSKIYIGLFIFLFESYENI